MKHFPWYIRASFATTIALILLLSWQQGWLRNLFTSDGFDPHGDCYLWLPGLVTLHVSSDALIGLAYVAISTTLIYFVYKTHHDLPFQWVFVAFGIFIVACGATHFMEIWTLWHATYWLSGFVKLITAVASVTTAIMLPPLIPKVLMLIEVTKVSEERKRQLEQTHKELEALYEKSRELDELKTRFFTNVSHEFRTRLTSIQGFSEMMSVEQFSVEEMKEYARDINTDAHRLNRMISDMLDLERIEAGQLPLRTEAVNLNRILRDVAENTRIMAPKHSFSLELEPTLPLLLGDGDKLMQVVINLVSNAVKYSPQGGEIRLSSEFVEDKVHVSVRDHGIGIPSEALERVFERYARIASGNTRYIQGSGLGLPIVRQIIQMHKGKVWAESIVGQGSTFHFMLPLIPIQARVGKRETNADSISERRAQE